MRVVEDLNLALHQVMQEASTTLFVGEDILDPYGGAFKVSQGLSSKFPGRVLTTPISEAALVGFSIGAALRGTPVIAEIMFGDFTTLVMDQLINLAAKLHWMFNEGVRVPLVVRTPMGGGRGYGPTHSQSLEKHFCGIPGLTVLAVHPYASPGQLLRKATGLKSPVLFIENKLMYAQKVQLGVLRAPSQPDVTLVAYGGSVQPSVRAAELLAEDEIIAEVVPVEDLWPLNASAIIPAVRKTGKLIVVEEGAPGWGFSGQVLEELVRAGVRIRGYESVAGPSHPIPSSKNWELELLPNAERIKRAALGVFLN